MSSGTMHSCSTLCKLLSVPTRLEILVSVAVEPTSVTGISGRLGLEHSLVSHHLKLLKNAGLVASKQVGHKHEYGLGTHATLVERTSERITLSVKGGDSVGLAFTLPVSPSWNGVLGEPKPTRAPQPPRAPRADRLPDAPSVTRPRDA